MLHFKDPLLLLIDIKQIKKRIDKTRQQDPAGLQDSRGFPPHRTYMLCKQVRYGMNDQIEFFVSKDGQIGHVPLHGFYIKAVPLRNKAVLLQLFLRIVEYDNVSPRRRQHRALLTASGCET